MAISLLVDLAPAVRHMTRNTHVPTAKQTLFNCKLKAAFTHHFVRLPKTTRVRSKVGPNSGLKEETLVHYRILQMQPQLKRLHPHFLTVILQRDKEPSQSILFFQIFLSDNPFNSTVMWGYSGCSNSQSTNSLSTHTFFFFKALFFLCRLAFHPHTKTKN